MMKVLNLILAALFLVSALLQLNDPDALEWTSLYLAAALVCGFAAFGRYNRWIILLVMAACVYEASSRLPTFRQWLHDGMPTITGSMEASSPYVELVREFLGVTIVLVVMVFEYTRCRMMLIRKQREQAGSPS